MDIPCKVEDIFKMYIILQHITKYIKDEWVISQITGGFHIMDRGSICTSCMTPLLNPGELRKRLFRSRGTTASPVMAPSLRPYTLSCGKCMWDDRRSTSNEKLKIFLTIRLCFVFYYHIMFVEIEGAMKNEYIKSCSQATLLNTHMMFRTVRLRSFKHKSFLHSMAIFLKNMLAHFEIFPPRIQYHN